MKQVMSNTNPIITMYGPWCAGEINLRKCIQNLAGKELVAFDDGIYRFEDNLCPICGDADVFEISLVAGVETAICKGKCDCTFNDGFGLVAFQAKVGVTEIKKYLRWGGSLEDHQRGVEAGIISVCDDEEWNSRIQSLLAENSSTSL